MRILLSAYACEPGKGSEPGVGWNVAKALAAGHQVWILTSRTHRPDTDAELTRNRDANLRVVYLDPFGWAVDWSRRRLPGTVYFHYYLWQICAFFVGRSLHRQVGFDVAHHVTYVKYSTPSFISLLPIPFFWGPVGGGESAPRAFWNDFNRQAKAYEIARRVARTVGEWDPFVRMTARRSVFAWATTEETAERVRAIGARRVEILPSVALDRHEARRLADLSRPAQPEERPLRFISTGRLLHWKGFHLGLRAFAQCGLPDAEYWMVGDGPERERLEALASSLGIGAAVRFWGELDREDALSRLGECDVLVHPSLHDSGGWVCLEAMAAGRPVICLDLGGPPVLVSDDCGIRVPARTPGQAIDDLADAMTRVGGDHELRVRMGQAGQRRITGELTWEHHVEAVVEAYRTAP